MTLVCVLYLSLHYSNSNHPSAGQLVWFDPETGKPVVYNGGDIAWTLASTALVWIMIPGLGFLYSGNLRSKNGLSMLFLSVGTIAVVAFQVSVHDTSRLFIHTKCNATVVFLGILFRVQ
jgi:hypothetical protein